MTFDDNVLAVWGWHGRAILTGDSRYAFSLKRVGIQYCLAASAALGMSRDGSADAVDLGEFRG